MAQDRKEYWKSYYQAHKKDNNARSRAYYKAHKKELNDRNKAYRESHKEERKEYLKSDVNSLGQTKDSIRHKSSYYLNTQGTKIPGYEIHHCCTYNEPYKFIYCSKDKHKEIHAYLRDNNIPSDSDHYDLIKHLFDDKVVIYGITKKCSRDKSCTTN